MPSLWVGSRGSERLQPVGSRGSNHVFTHPSRPGIVVVPHPRKDLGKGLVAKIRKQAGI